MKVLTASAGDEPDDFAHATAGELVYFGLVCARDEYGPGGCGCGRAFTGLASGSATTLAAVADLEMDLETLTGIIADHLVAAGWTEVEQTARELAEDIAAEAAEWPEGTLLRRQLDEVVAS